MAPIHKDLPRRLMGWSLLVILMVSTHLALIHEGPLLRMFGICCVLLATMKGLVYAEWARRERLTWVNYLVFACCWFGMDPVSFRRRKSGLSWKGDFKVGLLLTALGLLACWWVWEAGWRHILIMFVPMSLAFHFGILRLLKVAMRLAGYPVRTLFPNVLKAEGIGDFWSRRWNVGYSQMMQRLVGRPVSSVAGPSAGIFAVFVGSGILHELAITLPVQSGYGLPTLFFTGHGLLTVMERKWGRSLGRIPALLAVALPLSVLFPPAFQSEVIVEILSWFDALPKLLLSVHP
ncbi:MAG: MBOAT family protein [Akkermansiaceae bacterium]|nr:MBOAT family protein [Akkermansiaceae bacterium]